MRAITPEDHDNLSGQLSFSKTCSAIALAWVAALLFIGIDGNFPILDDWAYAQTVRHLLDTGELRLTDWGSMNLISQVGWGAAFAWLFGPGYVVLRLSTLALAVGASLAMYRIARLSGGSRGLSLLATAAGTFNPLFLPLAFSFMTDVPAAAALLIAVALLASRGALVRSAGWAAGLFSLLCRQNALVLPIAWTLSRLRGGSWRRGLLHGAMAISAFVAVQKGYRAWLEASGHLPKNYGFQIDAAMAQMLRDPLAQVADQVAFAVISTGMLGLFLLPATLPLGLAWLGRLAPPRRTIAVATWFLLTAILAGWHLRSATGFVGDPYANMGTEAIIIITDPTFVIIVELLAFAGVVLLGALLARAGVVLVRRADEPTALLALVLALGLFAPLPFLPTRFDRYLVPIIPFLAAGLLVTERELMPGAKALTAGVATAALLCITAILGTHDFMAWKRVHGFAYVQALRQMPSDRVDGGWVLNGERHFARMPVRSPNIQRDWHLGRYVVVRGEPTMREAAPGYTIVARYPTGQWLAPRSAIVVERRLPARP